MAQNLPTPVDPAIFSALDPDSILPEQFFPEQQPNWTGEMSLLWTVFSDGLETFCKEISLGHEQGELFLETVEWVEFRGHESIFSFESLCEVFHLNPGSVRQSLRAWRERHLALNSKAA